MQDFAQIRETTGGDYPYMLTVIDCRSGLYYPCSTVYFDTLQAAEEYAKENNLKIVK